jgi:hypothetical protein
MAKNTKPTGKQLTKEQIRTEYGRFVKEASPIEKANQLLIQQDLRTGAWFLDCHLEGSNLIALGTIDVPLDPDDQAEYRANREIVAGPAFEKMKEDAKKQRSFSNIVVEYTKEFDPKHPLKVIGGQHRFQAIKQALEVGVNAVHGVKVYLSLNAEQRLDVQLISNTNIATSTDLFDRMQETVKGPELRDWCQSVGLLAAGTDFTDRRTRGGPISVQLARTFITNFYLGRKIDPDKFSITDTTPELCTSGEHDTKWESLRTTPAIWKDKTLLDAGKEFGKLASAQRAAFQGRKGTPPDYPEKAMNAAILASWAYVAGMLQKNPVRLKRHFELATAKGRDPLNAAVLATGRHKTDPANYRGLGYRTDVKERGRFVELFSLQAENGKGIAKPSVDAAIAQYHAKRAVLEAQQARARAG